MGLYAYRMMWSHVLRAVVWAGASCGGVENLVWVRWGCCTVRIGNQACVSSIIMTLIRIGFWWQMSF